MVSKPLAHDIKGPGEKARVSPVPWEQLYLEVNPGQSGGFDERGRSLERKLPEESIRTHISWGNDQGCNGRTSCGQWGGTMEELVGPETWVHVSCGWEL